MGTDIGAKLFGRQILGYEQRFMVELLAGLNETIKEVGIEFALKLLGDNCNANTMTPFFKSGRALLGNLVV